MPIKALLYPFGFLASLAFSARFLIQWFQSEKEERSVSSPLFWKFSLLGNILLYVHSIIQVHFPLAAIQILQALLSFRNLNLQTPPSKQISRKKLYRLFVYALLLTSSLFISLSFLKGHRHIHWLESPHSLFVSQPQQIPITLHAIGLLGVFIYSLRFWVQWWQAENKKNSSFTKSFWHLSIFGAILSIIYFALLLDWVNLLGPLFALVPYSRNLLLLLKNEKKKQKQKELGKSFFLFCGEKSGLVLAEKLIQSVQKSHPETRFFGVIDETSSVKSFDCLLPLSTFQHIGFSKILFRLPSLIKAFFLLKKRIMQENPQVALFIDQPDFSYRLATSLKKAGFQGKIVQYVAPSVWAWRQNRAQAFASSFDLLLTLFPFEAPYFTPHGLQTVFTGHPFVEMIDGAQDHTREKLITLFPGSRKEEVLRNLPLQLDAALPFAQKHALSIAISVSSKNLEPLIYELIERKKIERTITLFPFDKRYEYMKKSTLALTKAGSVTLELGLFKVPSVVLYSISKLNYFLGKYLFRIDLPYFCLVNILQKKEVFPELIRKQPTKEELALLLEKLYQSTEKQKEIQEDCTRLQSLLQASKKPSRIMEEEIAKLLI